MKEIVFSKKQISKLCEDNEVTTVTATTINGMPATSQDKETMDYAAKNPDKVTAVIANANKQEGPVAQAKDIEGAKEQLQKNQDIKQVTVPQVTGSTYVAESYKKSDVEKMRLNEMRKHSSVYKKSELDEILRR